MKNKRLLQIIILKALMLTKVQKEQDIVKHKQNLKAINSWKMWELKTTLKREWKAKIIIE